MNKQPVQTRETPRGEEQLPKYVIITDATLPESQYHLAFHAWNILTAIEGGPVGAAFRKAYNLGVAQWQSYQTADLSGYAAVGPANAIEQAVKSGQFAAGEGYVYVLIPSKEHAGSGFGSQWGGYHGASADYPYIWAPFDETASGYLDFWAQVLSHEAFEYRTDTWPGSGVIVPPNAEVGDVCEGATFKLPAGYSWTYTIQGFAVLEWSCWTPGGDLPIPPTTIPGNPGI